MKLNKTNSILKYGIFKNSLFILSNLILLSFLFVKSNLISESIHFNYQNQLGELRELDSEIDGEALANYMNFIQNYDKITNDVDQLLIISQKITEPPEHLLLADRKNIKLLSLELQNAFIDKAYQIELFKRNNAILKNSLNFLKKISEKFMNESSDAEVSSIMANYTQQIMYFVNKPEGKYLKKIVLITNELNEVALNGEDKNAVDNILLHGGTLLKYRQKVNDQIQRFIHLPAEHQQENLMQAYIQSHRNVLEIAQRYQYSLFAYSILLSLYLVYLFLHLNKANKAIYRSHQELTERYEVQSRIEKKLLLHDIAFSKLSEAITLTDAKGNIIDMNPAFSIITGYSREETIGRNPRVLKSGRHDNAFYKKMWDDILNNNKWRGEIWNRKKNGEIYPEILSITAIRNEKNEISNFLAIFSDISHLKLQEKKLKEMAFYDNLTKLPNRVLLTDRMNQAISQVQRLNTFMATCFLDLDGFKEINDTYGHEAGDRFLIEMTSRFKSILREGDTIARIGGDEFVLILVGLKEDEEYRFALHRLQKVISQPVNIKGDLVKVTASIGVTLYPHDNQDADTLLRNADQAMYEAKQKGKNCYVLFDHKHSIIATEQNIKIKSIRNALNNNELVLYYQPKIEFSSGNVVGVEALIRWEHPSQGLIPPNSFLPFIENNQLIVDVGYWVLTRALSQISVWKAEGLDIHVSVNVSSLQLQDPNFTTMLEKLLSQYPIVDPHQIELEILETTALEDIFNTSLIIEKCREIGVNIALDDFGTGYSSLTYLKQLPAQALKIDMSFVKDMLVEPGSLAIVHGILGLTTAFQMRSVAEGVESLDHGVILMKLGCKYAQGYGIAKPMPAKDIIPWINNWISPEIWREHANLYWNDADYPMLVAEVEHMYWINSVSESVNSASPIKEIRNYHLCNFGQWYFNVGKTCYQHLSEFNDIEQPYIKAHKIAEEINIYIQTGEIEKAKNSLNSLISQNNIIITKLRDLSLSVALKK